MDTLSLADKVVVVTGAGGGLGRAYALHAAALGASLVVADIDATAADLVVNEILVSGGQAIRCEVDVSVPESARELISFCVNQYSRIDGLVNNAGVQSVGMPDEITVESVRHLVEVNLLGTVYCGLEAIRAMQQSGTGGAIVNVSSGSQAGIDKRSIYAMTKGGISSLTYSWAIDLSGTNIRVNALSPVATTGMAPSFREYFVSKGVEPPIQRISPPPETCAPVVSFLLSDFARKINGQVVRIHGSELSLLTHPAILHPVVRRDEWTFEAVSHAFGEDLAARQQPLGLALVRSSVVDD